MENGLSSSKVGFSKVEIKLVSDHRSTVLVAPQYGARGVFLNALCTAARYRGDTFWVSLAPQHGDLYINIPGGRYLKSHQYIILMQHLFKEKVQ